MGIAGSCIDLVVAQQFPNHRQRLAESESPARPTVAEVMEPHVFQIGFVANPVPVMVEVAKVSIRPETGNHPRIALDIQIDSIILQLISGKTA